MEPFEYQKPKDRGKVVGVRIGRRGQASLRVPLRALPVEHRAAPWDCPRAILLAAAKVSSAEAGHVVGWAPIYATDTDAHLVKA